jgi:hypothetical protein
MKTEELTSALLDYWVARAEGVPAEHLEIRPVQRPDPRTPDAICVKHLHGFGRTVGLFVLDYSTNWALAGPLMEKHAVSLTSSGPMWYAGIQGTYRAMGHTPLIAICRAAVRAVFGDEVEDLPC